MSNPILLQDRFNGMWRDSSRDQLPNGKVWDLLDYIPNELGAPLRRRGGWTQFGDTMTDIDASAGDPARVGVVVFSSSNEIKRLLLRDENPPSIGGNFTLTFNGQTTGNIAYNASASTIQTALEALSNIAPGDVAVTDNGTVAPETIDVRIEFTGTYAASDQSITTNIGTLSGDILLQTSTLQNGGAEGTQVVVIDDRANPELFDLTNNADRGSVYGTTAAAPMGPLVSYRNILLIPSPALATSPVAPRKYLNTGTISALGGSPPGIRFFAIYKDRVVGASADTDLPNRLFFSAAGNAESWDTTNRYIDTSGPTIALAPLRSALLVFHSGSVERIRGDIPPGSAAANMTLEPLFSEVGIKNADALSVHNEYAYWADEHGVYRTDGASLTNLTEQGGISSYWRERLEDANSVALAVWQGYVWISILGENDLPIDVMIFNVRERFWFRFQGVDARNFAEQSGQTDELYFSNRDGNAVVGKLSTVFDPTNNLGDKGSSVGLTPQFQTGFFNLASQAVKRWRHIYLEYELIDDEPAGSDATIQAHRIDDPSDISVSNSFGEFAVTSLTNGKKRRRLALNKAKDAFAFHFFGDQGAEDNRIYAIEAEVMPQEGSRRRG